MEKNNRIIYFDFLRIFATLGIVLLHVSGSNWGSVDVNSFEWQVFNVGDSVTRWCVPVFVMMSGALFLGREISIERLIKKNIFRIITAFAFWSVVYAVVKYAQGASLRATAKNLLSGSFHMWYLFMCVALYLLVPLLNKLCESMQLVRYFLLLAFVFSFFLPQLLWAASVFFPFWGGILRSNFTKLYFYFTQGYVSYFVLGYYLNKVEIPKKYRRIIYVIGLLAFASTVYFTYVLSAGAGKAQETMFGTNTLNVLMQGVSVFVFGKYNLNPAHISDKLYSVISRLSKYSFGVYLVHPLILDQLKLNFGINTLMFHPILSVLMITALAGCLSFVISGLCNHIPILKKYIV